MARNRDKTKGKRGRKRGGKTAGIGKVIQSAFKSHERRISKLEKRLDKLARKLKKR